MMMCLLYSVHTQDIIYKQSGPVLSQQVHTGNNLAMSLHDNDDDNDDDDDDPRQGPVHWLAPHPAGGLLAAGREDGVVAVMKVGEAEMSPEIILTYSYAGL